MKGDFIYWVADSYVSGVPTYYFVDAFPVVFSYLDSVGGSFQHNVVKQQ